MKIVALDYDKTCTLASSIKKMPRCEFHPLWFALNQHTPFDFDKNPELRVGKEEFNSKVKNLLDAVKTKNAKVIIASYGSKQIIDDSFVSLGCREMIDGIYTPSDLGGVDFHAIENKASMLEKIASDYSVEKSDIILVDDSHKNVFDAHKAGFKTVLCEFGITDEAIDKLVKLLEV